MELWERAKARADQLRIPLSDPLLGVSIALQTCTFFKSNLPPRAYTVSTSRNPPSCRENSLGTPTGLHRIAEKIGDGAPPGMVFRGRQPTGQVCSDLPDPGKQPNLITSRILWLEGLEPGHNQGPGVDSRERYIYLHGTNHEERLGQPFSGGCIEFSNADIIELFDLLPVGTIVWIEAQ